MDKWEEQHKTQREAIELLEEAKHMADAGASQEEVESKLAGIKALTEKSAKLDKEIAAESKAKKRNIYVLAFLALILTSASIVSRLT